jgi:hypothetical protein
MLIGNDRCQRDANYQKTPYLGELTQLIIKCVIKLGRILVLNGTARNNAIDASICRIIF